MKTVLLLTWAETPAFTAMKANILPLAKARGWAVHAFALGGMDTTADKLVKAWNPDGCIVYAAKPNGLSGNFGAWRKPVVTISAPQPMRGISAVEHDSHMTGTLAARELLSLEMENFAFFSDTVQMPWTEARFSSFSDEIKRHELPVRRYMRGSVGDWLVSLPKPCGIFAANDLMAERIVSEAANRGIAIPNDIAIVGCDDDPLICEHSETTISSIRPDFSQCASLAVDALACAIEGRRCSSCRIYGDVGVTRRASTRPTAGSARQIARVLEYIRLNARNGLVASDVLSLLGGSRRSAEIRFRKATGHSILDEIQSVRLAEVERLLADPLVSIGVIASRVGYGSENFLARIFKRTHGMTMREWRRQNRPPTAAVSITQFSRSPRASCGR